ncbi:MAG: HD domain-containing phosphohydrolase [bacterium]
MFNFLPLFIISFVIYYFSFSDLIKSLVGSDLLFVQSIVYFVLLQIFYVSMYYVLSFLFGFRVFFNDYYSFFYEDFKSLVLGILFNSALFIVLNDLSGVNIYLVFLLVLGLIPIALTNYNYNWIVRATMNTVEKIADIIEAKNSYAKNHSRRVSDLCVKFGYYLGLDYDDIEKLEHAAKIMNIGYISIPEYILLKNSSLNLSEERYIKEHSLSAYNILQKLDMYKDIATIIKYHHESWDGSGYPEGIRGNAIPILSRILKICDVFLALLEDRSYRNAYTLEQALEILEKEKSKFDPEIYEKFIDFIYKEYKLNKVDEVSKVGE